MRDGGNPKEKSSVERTNRMRVILVSAVVFRLLPCLHAFFVSTSNFRRDTAHEYGWAIVASVLPVGAFEVAVSSQHVDPLAHDASATTMTTARADEGNNNSTESSSQQIALSRAWELGSVALHEIVAPLLGTLITRGVPHTEKEVKEFWLQTSPNTGRRTRNISTSSSFSHHHITHADRVLAALETAGPTYVKFGQALSSRGDLVPEPLVASLSKLQDSMQPTFDISTARDILRTELLQQRRHEVNATVVQALVQNLSLQPVAAASIGQVYKSVYPGYGPVAIKIQRPGILDTVHRDKVLLWQVASFLERLQFQSRAVFRAKLVDAVDEFMSRLYEELDYTNEVKNMQTFAALYCHRRGSSATVRVVVPEVLPDYCTAKVIVMEWLEGTTLTEITSDTEETLKENLELLRCASASTLSQLFDTGILHADPHSGNLVKVRDKHNDDQIMLGFWHGERCT
jgi:ABC1 atypical kinase-like domain